jgi:UDP-glucose 4-epimerase
MRALVTGSSGHLGEALVRTLSDLRHEVVGLDRLVNPFTNVTGSITDRACVAQAMRGVDTVFHTATLHRPHIGSHRRQDFIDANITGTLNLLEEAAARVRSFVFASTTSVFGEALVPPPDAPAAWITEDVTAIPRNIYGLTKLAAEELCRLFHRDHGLACVVLRVSRFFPEEDFDSAVREAFANDNMKVNEYLYRRVDLGDAASACLLAAEHAPALGFARYIVSATTPFGPSDLTELRNDAPHVVRRYFPRFEAEYARRGWRMVSGIDRLYVNERARRELGWRPVYDFELLLDQLRGDGEIRSPLAHLVGSKGYHRGG